MGLFVKGTPFFRFQNLLGSVSISGSVHLEMGQKRLSGMAMITVYRTLGSAEISVQHGPYGFRFGQLMFCRGVATDILLGVMHHRQCGQQTSKYPQNWKTAILKHFHLESEVNVSTSNSSHCVKPVSSPPSSDAHGRGK